ncbi:JAB domain-containing protein [Flavobacterium sp. A45]|uniref:JAB domain-containing protein n=1 Tax=Flavobacterium sp. A45 TaxID=1945862 RepID=UPI0009867F1A|nr:JAB domain-containing protein [Flavobacterium sp. A45]OOG66807.1 DNA repair protein [Flavobacterium sp. A45]
MEVAEIKVSYSNTNLERIKITSSQALYSLVLKQWNLDLIEFKEEVKIVLLNRASIVLGMHELSKGGISGAVVDIRIILGIALKCNATSIVLVHNHPSGNLEPSEPDKSITQRLKEASKLLDLNLLDHLIITKEGYYSFSDNGIL